VDEYMLDRFLVRATPPAEVPGVEVMTAAHLPAVLALDAEAFGADRRRVLEGLCGAAGARGLVSVRDGAVSGYACVRPGANASYLGPWVAQSPEEAAALLMAAKGATQGRDLFVDLSLRNSNAPCIARLHHFERQRSLVRMYRGPNDCPGDTDLVFGIAGPEVG